MHVRWNSKQKTNARISSEKKLDIAQNILGGQALFAVSCHDKCILYRNAKPANGQNRVEENEQ